MRTALVLCGLSLTACLIGAACATSAPAEVYGETSQPLVAAAQSIIGSSLGPKQLALTFDDGPGPRTGELSTYLKAQNIQAVFFVNGRHLAFPLAPLDPALNDVVANPAALMAQLKADGHLLANHTTTHNNLTAELAGANGANIVVQQVSQTDDIIKSYVPSGTFLFRAPYGAWSSQVYDALKLTPMKKYVGPVYWDIGGSADTYPNAAADWACWQGQLKQANGALANGNGYATSVQCSDGYVKEIDGNNGVGGVNHGIVLLHDPYAWAQGSTVDLVKDMVPKLKAKGYTFVRADKVPAILTALGCDASCGTCSGTQANECLTCKPGTYLSGTTCVACSQCNLAQGKYEQSACTAANDTVCAACATCDAGKYAKSACAAAANTVCAACDAACATCTGPATADCGTCATGNYKTAAGCAKCTVCKPGERVKTACNASTDTTCEACPAGTSGNAGECSACASGSFAVAGSAICQSCGNCDDGNACTTDSCNAATGCAHEAIAGCNSGGGTSGATSGGASGGSGSGGGCSTTSRPGNNVALGALVMAAALSVVARRRKRHITK
jgi:peptidoglycan/xylan/chitin deacetylase (PgdA/CDA1 family)